MEKWKLLVMAAIGVIALIAGLYAQEQAPGVFRTPEELQKPAEDGINSGWVVAYGVLLNRPYFVEFRDDTVRINEIPWFPRRESGDSMKKEVSPKSAIYRRILQTYWDYYLSSGKAVAEEKVLQEFGTDTLISKMEFDPETDDLLVTWLDGLPEVLYLQEGLAARMGFSPSQEEIRRDAAAVSKADLAAGKMIVFGVNYSKTLGSKSALQIIGLTDDIRNGAVSKERGQTELRKYVNAEFADDVMENIDRW
jgi:hypothetical protein